MYYNYIHRYCYYTHRPDFITCKFKFNIWLVIWKMRRLACCVGKKYMSYYCYRLQLKRMRTERALISWNALPCTSSVFKVFKNVQIRTVSSVLLTSLFYVVWSCCIFMCIKETIRLLCFLYFPFICILLSRYSRDYGI